MWDRICEFASGPLTTAGLVLRIVAMSCIVFGFVSWFMLPGTDRARVKIKPVWMQRDAFEYAKHYHLFLAGTAALVLSGLLGLIAEFV